MARTDNWGVTEDAKAAIASLHDNSFRDQPDAVLKANRLACQISPFENDTQSFGLTQTIAAISDELTARYSRRINRWLIGIGVATLAVALVTLAVAVVTLLAAVRY